MKRSRLLVLAALALLGCRAAAGSGPVAASARVLWRIGKPDNNNAEFALAPGGYCRFQDDAYFLVGQSDPKRDWPYVHPGPLDTWAGGRSSLTVSQSPSALASNRFDSVNSYSALP